jgi:hypothetical protein
MVLEQFLSERFSGQTPQIEEYFAWLRSGKKPTEEELWQSLIQEIKNQRNP